MGPQPEPQQALPQTARTIALLLAATPNIQDAQPGVLHQLLEFSHRYTSQVLIDAQVYAEHAGRSGKIEMEDVTLAVQARVGWEFGGRVPKEYLLSLATQINAEPLPAVPETFGIRLPPASHRLTEVDFDLVPNKPPPADPLYEEVEEEVEDEDPDEEMVLADAPVEADQSLEEQDGLFDSDDDDTPPPQPPPNPNGVTVGPAKRKLEEEDYD